MEGVGMVQQATLDMTLLYVQEGRVKHQAL
jgi:hypothetical protein